MPENGVADDEEATGALEQLARVPVAKVVHRAARRPPEQARGPPVQDGVARPGHDAHRQPLRPKPRHID
eukprot:7079668-Prymnesium_polylepis.1